MDDSAALAVVAFWRAAGPPRWFRPDPRFDTLVRLRLGRLHEAAAAGALDDWARTATGSLALLILLDQAPRNMFRATARAFATDPDALALARAAVQAGFERRVIVPLRQFFFLPFMHSEVLADQLFGEELYRRVGDRDGLHWAEVHADVIRRFGRFPHRNGFLGRVSTEAEVAFLAGGGFAA